MASNDPPQDLPGKPGGGTDTKEKTQDKVDKPRNYKVVLHNDDFTTMEFVIMVLVEVFRKSNVEAARVMLTVHRSGKGVAGIYTREVAETKAEAAMKLARSAGYPLLVETEPE